MMKVQSLGFTGTRHWMTKQQVDVVSMLIDLLEPSEVHHGDCVGADAQFHDLVRHRKHLRIIIHPPDNDKLRAFCTGGRETTVAVPKDYRERNVDIINCSDLVIGAPKDDHEVQRSGTWMTIRTAHGLGKPVIVVYPIGRMERRDP
jgi:hypothetical protein